MTSPFEPAAELEATMSGAPAPTAGSVAVRGGRGAISIVAFTVGLNLVRLVSSLVLARQLAPEAYGAFAVGSTVVGFGHFFADGGAGSAVIQAPGTDDALDQDLGRSLTLQASIGLIAALGLSAAAPLIRSAFNAPSEVVPVILGMSLALVLEVPTVVPRTRLRRQQRYERLQALSALSYVALYVVQIGGLLLGLGLWALVLGQIAYALTGSAAMTAWGGGLVRPVLRGALALGRRGLSYQGAFIVQALFSITSVAVVGTQLSTNDLGLYTWCTVLATPLIALAQNLHGVTFPALSRLHEFHQDRHADAVAMVARLQALFVAAAIGLLCGLTVPLVRYVFDDRWLDAVGAARASLLGVLPVVLAALLAAALESAGRPRLRLRAMALSTATGVAAAVPLTAAYGTTGGAVAIFLLVPLLDAALLAHSASARLRRAYLDALVVGAGTAALGLLLARSVDGLGELLGAAALDGLLSLVLIVLVDQQSLRTTWTMLRSRD